MKLFDEAARVRAHIAVFKLAMVMPFWVRLWFIFSPRAYDRFVEILELSHTRFAGTAYHVGRVAGMGRTSGTGWHRAIKVDPPRGDPVEALKQFFDLHE